ncbi:glycosytransferase [Pseudomonas gingeri]|uniref:glycosyltransferase n=1 Tax=Pseudomonas gingeri TaxID=117681 RepID=UPI00159FAD40|nr:glycosyltransferase [Pseudomonas gingeri]NWD75396.1 glycosytransferase [Pseudomonas gingeri]
MSGKPLRVMWLLNHGSARKFELPMLKSVGITEIFLPKSYPQEVGFRSANVDYSEDASLTIPPEDLEILNAQNWYVAPTKEAWGIANKHFDICFFICHSPGFMNEVSRSFEGAAIWRAYGLDKTLSYAEIVKICHYGSQSVKRLGRRLWFGIAYDHLASIEPLYLQKRKMFLPLGLSNCEVTPTWKGRDQVIFFVCPDIGFSSYYKSVYEDFKRDFGEFSYKIGGSQPIEVDDPHVLGFVTNEEHESNMRESKLMFYHSREPNHIHYHPFEAIRVGMPLVFMAGGILDRMGGIGLPGRCENIAEAKIKIRKILNNDESLIRRICETQAILLDPMRSENCVDAWRIGFKQIVSELESIKNEQRFKPHVKNKKVAVVVPVEYRGGSLRGAKLMAQAIYVGARDWDEPVDVVLAHLDVRDSYKDEEFKDVSENIQRRAYRWKVLDRDSARRAMRYAGHDGWEPTSEQYMVPDDGIQQLLDCDAWIIISDRISIPLLPLRPCIFVVYDYLQRYERRMAGFDQNFIHAVRHAQKVLVTTEFTKNDAIQYAGVDEQRLVKLPMLAPDFSCDDSVSPVSDAKVSPYFVWTTNAGVHKNHENAFKALSFYYGNLNGKLDCHITGVDTKRLLKSLHDHLQPAIKVAKSNKILKKRLNWLGELPDDEYRSVLRGAAFLWHAGKIDNGTFSTIEAAYFGVPALSSDYPAMHEINAQFALNLTWMDPDDYQDMAHKLKEMEMTYISKIASLPTHERLNEQSVGRLGGKYWEVIRECL